jgi:5-formyltetrahydrofolate cyclo-ligase
MTKAKLREMYKARRLNIAPAEKLKLEDLMLIQFQKLDIEIPSLIMTYEPFAKTNEFDPTLITDYCYFKNPSQTLFYPVIESAGGFMKSVVVNDDTKFGLNAFGISEPLDGLAIFPEELDMIIIPLLAFDVKGHRVGYGKGYYDRFLTECKEDCFKIGFSFFDPEYKIDDADRYDVKLDYCITPERTYSF